MVDVVGHPDLQQQVCSLRSETDPAGEVARPLPEQMAPSRITGEELAHLTAVLQREIGGPACRRPLRNDLGDAHRHGDASFGRGAAGEPVVGRQGDRRTENGAEIFVRAEFAHRRRPFFPGRDGETPLRLFRPESGRSAEFQNELHWLVKGVRQSGSEPVRFPRKRQVGAFQPDPDFRRTPPALHP